MLIDEIKTHRAGKFTASQIHKLFVGGNGKTRETYILETAILKLTGYKKDFTSRHTEHGNLFENEAIDHSKSVLGLNLVWMGDRFIPMGDDAGCTLDCWELELMGEKVIATVDMKCPSAKFFDQKLEFVQAKKPEYQFVPKEYFYQGQMQMMVASAYLGYEVNQHRVVRYLPDGYYDELDEYHSFGLAPHQRIFAATIEADKEVQAAITEAIEAAVHERDLMVKILETPIINKK
jgi:hypothetical protein